MFDQAIYSAGLCRSDPSAGLCQHQLCAPSFVQDHGTTTGRTWCSHCQVKNEEFLSALHNDAAKDKFRTGGGWSEINRDFAPITPILVRLLGKIQIVVLPVLHCSFEKLQNVLRSDFPLKHILEKENSEITAHVSYKGTETLGKRKKMHSF